MLSLSLIDIKIDHVIVLDGWNELDQYQDNTNYVYDGGIIIEITHIINL